MGLLQRMFGYPVEVDRALAIINNQLDIIDGLFPTIKDAELVYIQKLLASWNRRLDKILVESPQLDIDHYTLIILKHREMVYKYNDRLLSRESRESRESQFHPPNRAA